MNLFGYIFSILLNLFIDYYKGYYLIDTICFDNEYQCSYIVIIAK
jgi:hypothetical protein